MQLCNFQICPMKEKLKNVLTNKNNFIEYISKKM
jgi:hypothetical protein